MTGARAMLEDRRDQALQDLIELDKQVQAGEIDDVDATALRGVYRADAARALRAINDATAPAPESEGPGRPRLRRRLVIGVAVILVALVGTALLLPRYLDQRPDGGFVTGNLAAPAGEVTQGGRDLDQVTNEEMEAVVAENPEVVGMRLRLAHRYLDEDDSQAAIGHYLAVLDQQDNPEAMSHIGWLLFNGGEFQLAERMLDNSLNLSPDDAEALWFLGNLRLYGLEDPAGAVQVLERLQRTDPAGAEAEAVAEVLAEARRAVVEEDQ